MPQMKSKRPSKSLGGRVAACEVLTLSEAAEYLRLGEPDLLQLIHSQGLPGRQISTEWRFLKTALQAWLSAGPGQKGLLSQAGAIKDDPFVEEMLHEIYQRRGRPETEQG